MTDCYQWEYRYNSLKLQSGVPIRLRDEKHTDAQLQTPSQHRLQNAKLCLVLRESRRDDLGPQAFAVE